MTVKTFVSSKSDEESIPNIIKNKLENCKTEVKLINNKEIKVGALLTVFSKNLGLRKIFKVSSEIIDYASLDPEPYIPRHGRLISEILKIFIRNNKGEEAEKTDRSIVFRIKCTNLTKYCYPIIFHQNRWTTTNNFEIENDFIKIDEGDWKMIGIVKESPYEVLNVSPNGGLLYTKLDPLISLRISKGIFKEEIQCKIQLCDISLDQLNIFRPMFDDQLSPYINLSQMVTIEILNTFSKSSQFRRSISIKLRLPDWVIAMLEEKNFDSKNIIKDQKKEKLGFYFLHKIDDVWNFVDSNLKFTNNSIEFEVKNFGSFIFVQCRDNREIRLCQNLNTVENLMLSESGIILTFLWIKNKNWFLWLEIVPVSRIKETRSKLESTGFIYIEQHFEPAKSVNGNRFPKILRKFSKQELIIQRRTFELMENTQFKLSLLGELEITENHNSKNIENHSMNLIDNEEDSPSNFDTFHKIGTKIDKTKPEKEEIEIKEKPNLCYHQNTLQSNGVLVCINPVNKSQTNWETIILNKLEKKCIFENHNQMSEEDIRIFNNSNLPSDLENELIEPSSLESKKATRLVNEEKEFSFYSELRIESINNNNNIPLQTYPFYISVDIMKQYFQVKTKEEMKKEEEIENERVKEDMEKKQQVEDKPIADHRKNQIEIKPKQINYNHLNGLARPRFAKNVIEKEPKIISRRSFLALSSIIRQGLKLAVYLSIPDNAIAGIGFDALSQMSMNGMNNTTYKVLLLWKKMILYNKTSENEYVEQLIYGLKSIGYERVADLVHRQWSKQQEISIDDCQRCLLQKD